MSLDLTKPYLVVICDDCANYAEAGTQDMSEAVRSWQGRGWTISRQNKTHRCPQCSSGWAKADNSWVV